MSFFRKLLAGGRIRAAKSALAKDPSPRTYAALAREYTRLGETTEVQRVCVEGLAAFPTNALLARLLESTRRMECEERATQLRRELAEAPRPAVWAEMCELLIELGRLTKADDTAREWLAQTEDKEARLLLARIRVERFITDRSRELGLLAERATSAACEALPDDARPYKLRLSFLSKIGAWGAALDTAKHLLQLDPGAPKLERRYRSLEERGVGAPTIDKALLAVERTGRFAEEGEHEAAPISTGQVRPILRELSQAADVNAALYVRGSTVLIQGPKGATAERISRGVRAIHSSGQATTRRLGLGRIFQIQLEGDFGHLTIAPSDMDAGAIWSRGALGRAREETLLGLAGLNADLGKVAS